MLNGIFIVCFAASYAIALCLEISRLFFRVHLRTVIMVGFALAGLVAHSIYLTREAQQGFTQGAPLSSWYHGCLIVAWLLAAMYVTLSIWKKPSVIGLFFLPTILALVAIAQIFPPQPQLTSEAANRVWRLVHGVALLLGTAAVMVGFLGGVLYLAQSYRLKQKIIASRGLRLPSLEILQRVSESALITSCCLLLLGLISGILLNWQPGEESVVAWTDPVVWPSGVLLLWLLAALSFNAVYKPARQGRKVAYLTMASFIFLGLVLAILMLVESSHGTSRKTHEAQTLRTIALGSRKCIEWTGTRTRRSWLVPVPREILSAAKVLRCSWPGSASTEILRSPRLPQDDTTACRNPVRQHDAYCWMRGIAPHGVRIARTHCGHDRRVETHGMTRRGRRYAA